MNFVLAGIFWLRGNGYLLSARRRHWKNSNTFVRNSITYESESKNHFQCRKDNLQDEGTFESKFFLSFLVQGEIREYYF